MVWQMLILIVLQAASALVWHQSLICAGFRLVAAL